MKRTTKKEKQLDLDVEEALFAYLYKEVKDLKLIALFLFIKAHHIFWTHADFWMEQLAFMNMNKNTQNTHIKKLEAFGLIKRMALRDKNKRVAGTIWGVALNKQFDFPMDELNAILKKENLTCTKLPQKK